MGIFPRLPDRMTKGKLPGPLAGLPKPALLMIGLLVTVNLLIWAAIGVVLHFYPKLITPAVLAYTLGLRHALDADHISAIDLTTRRLIASGQRPVAVGTFFSLGHSTIVVVTCVVVAATSGALRERFENFQRIGGIIGTSVSAAFLIILCVGNGWVLWRLVKRLRVALEEERVRSRTGQGLLENYSRHDEEGDSDDEEQDLGVRRIEPVPISEGQQQQQQQQHGIGGGAAAAGMAPGPAPPLPAGSQQQHHRSAMEFEGAGFLARMFRKVFKLVDRPWKMFPLGMLFGLGFDTSSEIALLGIASLQGSQGTSMWLILIFPILFTGKLIPPTPALP